MLEGGNKVKRVMLKLKNYLLKNKVFRVSIFDLSTGVEVEEFMDELVFEILHGMMNKRLHLNI